MAKEFDTTKGAFYLVAMVIITMMLIIIVSMGTCATMIIIDPKINPGVCESMREPLMQLFQMAFTASIAFAGGRMSAGSHMEPPKLPPEPRPRSRPSVPHVPPPPKLPEKDT